eukprot:CAMPEP_0183769360 /NCGR_PEP_ID=MMETSP0739-20130205/21434_1 /TAXON_ID=385413 /ORGANISM="Thalassiosira miniscula, Strain CCMP1093" /LENGTH=56 /DNA_ID=CAMNT_0026008933 /DNA_START=1 /DNA_END=168 /DNA_ORIENTATION=+
MKIVVNHKMEPVVVSSFSQCILCAHASLLESELTYGVLCGVPKAEVSAMAYAILDY